MIKIANGEGLHCTGVNNKMGSKNSDRDFPLQCTNGAKGNAAVSNGIATISLDNGTKGEIYVGWYLE